VPPPSETNGSGVAHVPGAGDGAGAGDGVGVGTGDGVCPGASHEPLSHVPPPTRVANGSGSRHPATGIAGSVNVAGDGDDHWPFVQMPAPIERYGSGVVQPPDVAVSNGISWLRVELYRIAPRNAGEFGEQRCSKSAASLVT
jgi:hypothetical protein